MQSALGRVLAHEVCSPLDVPAHRNSAMDGYAVRYSDLSATGEAALDVVGTALAGRPWQGSVQPGQAVRIMTGAVVPEGTDTVVMQERTQREGERVTIGASHTAGENVRHPGEDLARGQVVFSAGHRLRPADLGVLASLGIPEVTVHRRLRVAFFSTGDEIQSIGEPLVAGQIYDSNRYTLHGMLTRMGADLFDMGVIPDRREPIAEAFERAAAAADVVITSGGVSVGEADYVKETLERLGRVDFWKIAIKPGKPLAFGRIGNAWFFGLPGNPVSAMVTFCQVVRPALEQLAGQAATAPLTLPMRCSERLKKSPGRIEFQRGTIERDVEGMTVVRPTGHQGSHVLSSMSQADCFIVLPAEQGEVPAGSVVEVQPFDALLR